MSISPVMESWLCGRAEFAKKDQVNEYIPNQRQQAHKDSRLSLAIYCSWLWVKELGVRADASGHNKKKLRTKVTKIVPDRANINNQLNSPTFYAKANVRRCNSSFALILALPFHLSLSLSPIEWEILAKHTTTHTLLSELPRSPCPDGRFRASES